jgi:hypothetical protein
MSSRGYYSFTIKSVLSKRVLNTMRISLQILVVDLTITFREGQLHSASQGKLVTESIQSHDKFDDAGIA